MEKKSLEYQLGYFIGEYIVSRYLPVLDIDPLKTHNVIEVTKNEKEKFENLNNKWFKTVHTKELEGNIEWYDLRKYHNELIEKYIPEELTCYVDFFDVDNIPELKKGIGDSLWNSDLSHYSVEDIEIVEIPEENKWMTQRRIIILKREINEEF